MTYPGMTLKGFILSRDESFRKIRELANVAGSVRTLDSVLLEVTKNADKILHTHQVVLAFGSVDKPRSLMILVLVPQVKTLVVKIQPFPLALPVIRRKLFRKRS